MLKDVFCINEKKEIRQEKIRKKKKMGIIEVTLIL